MEKITKEEAYKRNTIWLANQHREDCCGEECNISLLLLMEMAETEGIKYTKKETDENTKKIPEKEAWKYLKITPSQIKST